MGRRLNASRITLHQVGSLNASRITQVGSLNASRVNERFTLHRVGSLNASRVMGRRLDASRITRKGSEVTLLHVIMGSGLGV